jgi:hypothetical protein
MRGLKPLALLAVAMAAVGAVGWAALDPFLWFQSPLGAVHHLVAKRTSPSTGAGRTTWRQSAIKARRR